MPYRDDFPRRVELCAQELSKNLESVVRNFETAQEVAAAMEKYGLQASDSEAGARLKAALEARTTALQIQSAELTTTDSSWDRFQIKCELIKDQLIHVYKEYLTHPHLLKGSANFKEVNENLEKWKATFEERAIIIQYERDCLQERHSLFTYLKIEEILFKKHFWQRGEQQLAINGMSCPHINKYNLGDIVPYHDAYRKAFEFYQKDNMNTERLTHFKENFLEIIQIPAALQQLIFKKSEGLATLFDFL